MDADTKRGADDCAHDLAWELELPVEMVLAALAAQGLHVVTAADKAVLDACEKATLHKWEGRDAIGSDSLAAIIAALVARREAAK